MNGKPSSPVLRGLGASNGARLLDPYRIMEGLPVIRPEAPESVIFAVTAKNFTLADALFCENLPLCTAAAHQARLRERSESNLLLPRAAPSFGAKLYNADLHATNQHRGRI